MKYVKGLRPTPSMVVSIIALVVACAGGAYAAATITGADIVNNSLSGKKVKNNTLKRKDLNKKFLASLQTEGPAGTNGTNGATGATGANGTNGTNGVNGGNGSNIPAINFERDGFVPDQDVDNQNGWTNSGSFDVEVAKLSDFPAAAGYGFGAQALRSSDATTAGGFGDQTFSPGLPDEAGETDAYNSGFGSGDRQSHFDASFKIGTALASRQTDPSKPVGAQDLSMSVAPDSGNGGRMSYLRFEDQADGVHVIFSEATNPGPLGAASDFSEEDIATISRGAAHTIRFSIDFVDGPGNDVVKIFVDGVLKKTGTTWEDYYRYDDEQTTPGGGNEVPTVDKLSFREGGDNATYGHPGNAGNGYLIDGVSLASSTPAP